MARLYLSYRRGQDAATARRITTQLEQLLIPCESIQPSPNDQFKGGTERAIKACDVVLVIIGGGWAASANRFGFSALYNSTNSVRREIEVALSEGVAIIPVLVGSATLPTAANVPGSIAPFLERQAVNLRDDPDFDDDLRGLIEQIQPGAAARLTASHHIFISYSRKDTAMMQRLRDDLRAAGLDVWVDEDGLEPGTPDWEKAIGAAIRGTVCLVAVLSPDAEQSTWVGRELAMAEMLDKRIFPVLARGDEREAIPFRLMSHQWVDGRQHYADALDKLLAAVRKHLSQS